MRGRFGLLGLALVGSLAAAPAQVTGHYVNGVEGLKAASLPPFKGLFYRSYNAYYDASKLAAPNGASLPVGFDVNVFASVHRLIWLTDIEILGGRYGCDIAVPLINTGLSVQAAGLKTSKFGVGDLYVEPFLLSWHGPRYDTAFGLSFYAPTGEYAAANPASPGKDMWTFMPTLGGTYYLTPERDWSLSVLGRYEIHSRMSARNITPGNDFHFEWGLANTIPTKRAIWDVGLAGYCQWQVTDDSGPGVTWRPADHDRVFAIGPEVAVMIPDREFALQLRTLWEFGAHDRSQGMLSNLTAMLWF